MNRILALSDALSCAVQTAQEQAREVPEATADWMIRAQAALDTGDTIQIEACAREVMVAHSQYRAEFDVKGWLFDLRNSVRKSPEHAVAAAALGKVIARTKKA